MAFSHFSFPFGWSSDTLNTVKFLFLYFLKAPTTFGFSPLQGTHQLAQKSTSTNFPLKSFKDTGLPRVSFWVKSSADLPMPVRLLIRMLLRILLAGAFSLAAGDNWARIASFSSRGIRLRLKAIKNALTGEAGCWPIHCLVRVLSMESILFNSGSRAARPVESCFA